MRIHFISIGGSAMHNLAIALSKDGNIVTGSDDIIFEPSKSRLKKYGLLPKKMGWDENNITEDIDAIVLGMHAHSDNPELIKAQALNLKIYSYPEFLYNQSKE
ncbi:MAG: peptidoglycan synthetase, partial [Fusobacteria bacterium]